MALPDFSMRQLLEAGAHFGHQAHRWNPKMSPYIFGVRNNIHILDLSQSVPMLHRALQAVSDTVARGGRVLFVGTKRQAQDAIADAAKRSAQYYVNSRWLGGMLTNWKTISASIQRLRKVDELLNGGGSGLTKKERLMLSRERDKLEKALGGIKDMGGTPDMIFVIDTNKEALAIKEAQRLGIPVAIGYGLTEAGTRKPDLLVLDLGLPDGDGLDVIRDVRGWSAVPIIVLSARVDEADKIAALDAGADDYLTKPFELPELEVRLEALVARASGVHRHTRTLRRPCAGGLR